MYLILYLNSHTNDVLRLSYMLLMLLYKDRRPIRSF